MNYVQKDWYNELYRIFSCNDALVTQTQAIKIGECLRALAAGENITYKLEELYQSFRSNRKVTRALENYMHQYIDSVKKDSVEQSAPTPGQEDKNYGNLQKEISNANSTDIY